MGEHINKGIFLLEMYDCFARRPKKEAIITRWPHYQGGYKAGFHSI